MKKKGARIEFNSQRDKELLQAFKKEFSECSSLPLEQIYFRAPQNKASRFWVSERRAATVVAKIMRGESIANMNPKKQEMFMEIYRRVALILHAEPQSTIIDATFRVVNSEAPEFYLTPKSARVIIYKSRA